MADILSELRERVAGANLLIEEGAQQIADGTAKKQLGEKQLAIWKPALDAELERSGQSPVATTDEAEVTRSSQGENISESQVIEPLVAAVTDSLTDDELEEGGKARLVRELFKQRGANGIRPRDISKHFASMNITINKNYAYSILQRLKRRKEIVAKGAKYYPTPLLGVSKADRDEEDVQQNGLLAQPVLN